MIPRRHKSDHRAFAFGFWLLSLVMVRGAGPGASGEYLIDVKTRESGLPNSSVTAIAQTSDGYLWVGTYNGLARFDGERFVRFDPLNTSELHHARVRRLTTTPDGTLWISAYDGSLTSYRSGQFTLEWAGDGSADSTAQLITTRSNQPVFMLRNGDLIRCKLSNGTNRWELIRPPGASTGELCVEDGAGVIWGRGRDQKMWRFTGTTFDPLPANGGLTGGTINQLVADSSGRLWVGTEREIAVWDGKTFQPMTPTNGEPVLNVNFLQVMSNGDVWCIAGERVRKSRGREWVFEVEAARGLFAGWRDRTGLHEDSNGGIWLYDYGKGIFHVRADGRVRQLAAEDNFPGERVDCFHEDREGNFWAGVDRGGLVRVREKRFSVLSPSESPAVSVTEDRTGAVWVGTFGGGLHRWADGDWQAFSLPGGTQRGFVFSLMPDSGGRLWASAGEEDLFLGHDGKFAAFAPAVHGVKALLLGRDGKLWIGAKGGLGVINGSQFKQFFPADGVQRTDVRALVEDKSGVIWAGAGDGTLYRVVTIAGSYHVTSFRAEGNLGGLPIWSLLADVDGGAWVGTFRGGLMRFAGGTFTRFTSKDGLPDDVICQLLDDGAGRLWVGSQQGIFRINKSELKDFHSGEDRRINCTAYGRYDGLPSLECSGNYQPAAWKTADGKLLFSTLKGVVSIKPGELAENKLPPPVVIENILVDGREFLASRVRSRFSQGSTAATSLSLQVPPGKRQVEIRFTGLSFVSPDRVRFKTRLDGVDRDWVEAGTRRSVQYTFLKSGNYRFHVIACNNDGVWNDKGAELALEILPYFYEAWWFKIVAGVALLGGIVFAVRRVFVQRLRKQVEKLERQRAIELDRARIAKDIHDDLGAGLTHITLLSELARRDTAQALPGHVLQISDMARELTRNMDEIVWAVDPQNDTLDSLVTYVCKFAQEYLNVAGVRCRLDLPAELPPYVLPAEVRHNLFLAIKEALNNIVKHAHASEVWLRLEVQRLAFTLVIEDDGCGLHATKLSGGAPSETNRISSGHGLENMRKRLIASGGRCLINGQSGKGTRVELSVDLTSTRSPVLATGQNGATHRT